MVSRWQDVPMPPRVAARPRDPQRGYPVPFVAQSLDEKGTIRVGPGAGLLEGTLVDTHPNWNAKRPMQNAGGGWELGEMNPDRQRLCQLEGICQVCGLPVIGKRQPRIHVAGLFKDEEARGRGGEGKVVFIEPSVCATCLPYALAVCPRLRTGVKKDETAVYVLDEWELVAHGAVIGPDGVEDGGARAYLPIERVRLETTFGLDGKVRLPVFVVVNVATFGTKWRVITPAEALEELAA